MPKKISILMAAILLCVSLTGCTSMISLTDEEEEEIAIYTSSLISKYNRNQTNGLTYISEQRRLEIEELEASVDNDRKSFVELALSFVDKLGSNFTELSPADAEKCKQIIFPKGFRIDQDKNVYTTYISPIYRLRGRKKSAAAENFP